MRSKVKTLIVLLALLLFASVSLVYAQVGGPYNLSWWTVDNGGGLVIGGNYELYSTAGQPEAYAGIASVGNKYTLKSGFWSPDYFRHETFLPAILKRPLPDLVGSFTISPANPTSSDTVVVTAVITNQGSLAADAFWVDFYVNPTVAPTVNLRWNDIAPEDFYIGIAWFVEAGLQPGQGITLDSNNFPGELGRFSIWDGNLPAGTDSLYLLVDSWNPTVAVGGVLESDETNNLSSMTGLNITGLELGNQSVGGVIAPRPAPDNFDPELMTESQPPPPTNTPASTPTLIPSTETPLPDTATATATLGPVDTVTPTPTAVITTATPVSDIPTVTVTATVTTTTEPVPATPETTEAEP